MITTRHYKKQAEELGERYAKELENLKFFKFDTGKNNFVIVEDIDRSSSEALRESRDKMRLEMAFIKEIFPFIAYITAPTEVEREDVAGQIWEKQRILLDNMKKFAGKQTDNYGFDPRLSDSEVLRHMEMSKEGFKIIAGKIEKVLPKIENKTTDDLVEQMLADDSIRGNISTNQGGEQADD